MSSALLRQTLTAAGCALTVAATPALAGCPLELATYGDTSSGARLEFTPTGEGATVTNRFRLLLDNDMVLDGIVMWTTDVSRPYGIVMNKCPEGDVTGEELSACTLWEGVIYAVDKVGDVTLLPAEGSDAPNRLLLPDLGPSLAASTAYGVDGFQNIPSDVFTQDGCQE